METNDNLNIVLVGMPGAGKTFMGGKLAKLLVHFSYVDIDEEIENQENMSISEIFEQKSEEYFRELESKTIKKFAKNKNQIISIGGGAFENPENIKALKENGLTFYLKASPSELLQRVGKQNHRPLLSNGNKLKVIGDMLKAREKNYKKAHFTIDTEGRQSYTILDNILSEYDGYVK